MVAVSSGTHRGHARCLARSSSRGCGLTHARTQKREADFATWVEGRQSALKAELLTMAEAAERRWAHAAAAEAQREGERSAQFARHTAQPLGAEGERRPSQLPPPSRRNNAGRAPEPSCEHTRNLAPPPPPPLRAEADAAAPTEEDAPDGADAARRSAGSEAEGLAGDTDSDALSLGDEEHALYGGGAGEALSEDEDLRDQRSRLREPVGAHTASRFEGEGA